MSDPEEGAAMAERRLSGAWRHLRRRLAAEVRPDVSDADLLERFVTQRDEAAFELLVWRHGRMVLGVCRRALRNHHDAEDAFQAAFLALARKAGSITRRGSVAAWLHQVSLRIALRLRRTAEKRSSLPLTVSDESAPDTSPEDHDLRTLLDQEVDRLPERYRRPVILCYLEGASYAEAGRELGCSRGTVATRLARARDLLRKRLLRRGITLTAGGLAALATGEASAALVDPTVKAAVRFAAGQTVTGLVPVRAVALAEGAVRTMFMSRIKTVAALLLACVLAVGGGAVMLRAWASDDHQKEAAGAPPARGGDELGRPADAAPATSWTEGRQFKTGQSFQSLAFSPDSRSLACADLQGPTVVWDFATGREVWKLKTPDGDLVKAVSFSPDGKRLATLGNPHQNEIGTAIRLWNPSQAQLLAEWNEKGAYPTSLVFNPNGKSLLVGFSDPRVCCLDLDLEPRWKVELPCVWSCLACSPDGRRVAVGGGEPVAQDGPLPGVVLLLDAATGKVVKEIKGQFNHVASTAFSPDGKLLATGSQDKIVRLWDVATGQEVRRLKGHADHVSCVAFSPDGKVLASGGGDDLVRLWDVATGQQVVFLKNEGPVTSLAFAPDGSALAAACEKVVTIWRPTATGVSEPKTAAPVATDRLSQLVLDLVDKQRNDEQVLEALFLATLARLPSDVEKTLTLGQLARYKDRKEGFADILSQLTKTQEYRDHLEAQRSRLSGPGR